jgi:hypothetical protein
MKPGWRGSVVAAMAVALLGYPAATAAQVTLTNEFGKFTLDVVGGTLLAGREMMWLKGGTLKLPVPNPLKRPLPALDDALVSGNESVGVVEGSTDGSVTFREVLFMSALPRQGADGRLESSLPAFFLLSPRAGAKWKGAVATCGLRDGVPVVSSVTPDLYAEVVSNAGGEPAYRIQSLFVTTAPDTLSRESGIRIEETKFERPWSLTLGDAKVAGARLTFAYLMRPLAADPAAQTAVTRVLVALELAKSRGWFVEEAGQAHYLMELRLGTPDRTLVVYEGGITLTLAMASDINRRAEAGAEPTRQP